MLLLDLDFAWRLIVVTVVVETLVKRNVFRAIMMANMKFDFFIIFLGPFKR